MRIGQQAKPTGLCWCGCGQTTRKSRFFVTNHDAKALKYLRRLDLAGDHPNDGMANLLMHFGYNPDSNRLWERFREASHEDTE